MAIPNTDSGWSLQDVQIELGTSVNDLDTLFYIADNNKFDPDYVGSKNGLLNFRNYGATRTQYVILHIYELGEAAPWSNIIDGVTNATSETDGLSNSNLIVAQAGHTDSAAKKCLDLVSAGYSDWYLPTRHEAPISSSTSLINTALIAVGGDPISDNTGVYQWLSTETSSTSAQAFREGFFFANPIKSANFKTRAVRKEISGATYPIGSFNLGGIIIRADIV